jgi:hypothetical protein
MRFSVGRGQMASNDSVDPRAGEMEIGGLPALAGVSVVAMAQKNANPAGYIARGALRGAFPSGEPWKSLSRAGKGAGTMSNDADASLAATLRDGLCVGAWNGR